VRPFVRAFLDIVFPPLCHLCKAPLPGGGELHLCAPCLDAVPFIDSPLCPRCGVPFATEGGADHLCGACMATPPPYAAARAAMLFAGPVRELVHRFKYDRKVHLRRPLGLLTMGRLGDFIAAQRADLVVPVPLHPRRLRERGYNQAILLGELLARRWRLPLSRRCLRRVRWTAPQITLTAAERSVNVRGAFAVTEAGRIEGKRLVLVDDVYTTGSTVCECARVLHRAGAAAVIVVTAARAID
jgi:ComF family protein